MLCRGSVLCLGSVLSWVLLAAMPVFRPVCPNVLKDVLLTNPDLPTFY